MKLSKLINSSKVTKLLKTIDVISSVCIPHKKLIPSQKPKIRQVSKSNWVEHFRIVIPALLKMLQEGTTVLAPPTSVKGMQNLDKSKFHKTVTVPTLQLPAVNVSIITKCTELMKLVLKVPGINPIADFNSEDTKHEANKVILFNPDSFKNESDIDGIIKRKLGKEKCDTFKLSKMQLDLSYENWNYNGILSAVLPDNSDGVGGYTTVGHIVHLNLRDDLSDYKTIIGQVLLDKVKSVKTVVNKINNIDSVYRNFQMEVLAGEPDFVTVVKEHGFMFKMDFSKVYWNSRLSTEHRRLVTVFNKDDIVFDMFAGIGPFAIPAAKKGCRVFANDLNPESYKWLNENCVLNKVKTSIETYNMDGREFAEVVIKKELVNRLKLEDVTSETFHIVMNLPAIAIEFTNVFSGLLTEYKTRGNTKTLGNIVVHCYCFNKGDNTEVMIKQRLAENLGCDVPSDCSVKFVRNVAPSKDMYCVRFSLSWDLLSGDLQNTVNDLKEEPAKKKLKVLS